jgi:hypothetical protein
VEEYRGCGTEPAECRRSRSQPLAFILGGEYQALVLRIDRTDKSGWAVFFISGRLELQHIELLRAHFDVETLPIILDFAGVRLVDRDVVEALAQWDLDGIRFENCPAYLLDWIARLRFQK